MLVSLSGRFHGLRRAKRWRRGLATRGSIENRVDLVQWEFAEYLHKSAGLFEQNRSASLGACLDDRGSGCKVLKLEVRREVDRLGRVDDNNATHRWSCILCLLHRGEIFLGKGFTISTDLRRPALGWCLGISLRRLMTSS